MWLCLEERYIQLKEAYIFVPCSFDSSYNYGFNSLGFVCSWEEDKPNDRNNTFIFMSAWLHSLTEMSVMCGQKIFNDVTGSP